MSKMSLCIDKDIILFISGDLCCGTNSEGYIKGGGGGGVQATIPGMFIFGTS